MTEQTFKSLSDPAAAAEIFDHFKSAFDNNGQTDLGKFLCTVGSLGGFASQQAVWKACIEPGDRNAGDFLVSAKNSPQHPETFYYGEPINFFLQATHRGALSFYSPIAGSVLNPIPRESAPAAPLPDLMEIFRHVTATIGGPTYGHVRIPSEFPPLPPIWPLLHAYWGYAETTLVSHGNAPNEWPLILGFVGARTVRGSAGKLGPTLSARIIMEAAICASKVDPRTVPGATSGLHPPTQWSNRALRSETQREVMEETYNLLPKRVPA